MKNTKQNQPLTREPENQVQEFYNTYIRRMLDGTEIRMRPEIRILLEDADPQYVEILKLISENKIEVA